jgi:probable HAF family extracellular repeat protein
MKSSATGASSAAPTVGRFLFGVRGAAIAAALILAAGTLGVEAQHALVNLGPFEPACDSASPSAQQDEAAAISPNGRVAGTACAAGTQPHAFSWTNGGGKIDIGTLGGVTSSALYVNDSGQVVGTWSNNPLSHTRAFSWTAATGAVDLGTLGGALTYPTAINASGQVVGYSYSASGTRRAFLWSAAGGMIDLGTPEPYGGSATAINAAGQVTGYYYPSEPPGYPRPFLWTETEGLVDLGAPPGATFVYAHGINDSGHVVGSVHSDPGSYAFLWTREQGFVNLGSSFYASEALDVNALGAVTGYLFTAHATQSHAMRWTPGAGMIDLGTLGGTTSMASSINGAGDVVGGASTAAGVYHAFLWAEADGMVDLGTLGGTSSYANAISDNGTIVGWATMANGVRRAVMWNLPGAASGTPPPGPSSPSSLRLVRPGRP